MNLTAITSRGAVGVYVALAAAQFLVSCAGSGGGGLSGGTSDGVSTPRHGLPRHEYPFDSNGQYKEEWAKDGERRKGWNSGRKYADIDFSRGASRDAEKKKTTIAAAPKVRSVPAKKEEKRSGGGFFASREKKVERLKPQKVTPSRQTTPASPERLIASNTRQPPAGSWDRSRVQSPPSNYQPQRRQPPVVQPEPRVEVRRAPSVNPAQPTPVPEQPVVRKPAPKPAPKPTPKPPPPKRYHFVTKGDTLYNISVRYKSTVGGIKSRNRLSSNTIRPGQKLEIP